MQTRHFPAHPKRAFGMLLAVPAAAGILALAGGAGVASATTPTGATRTASGVAATAGTSRTSATAITLAHPLAVVVSARGRIAPG